REAVREVVRDELRAFGEKLPTPLAQPNAGPSTTAPEFVTIKHAARLVEVHPATIRSWIREGSLGRHWAGSSPRVKLAELYAYLGRESGQHVDDDLDDRATAILGGPRRRREP